MKVYQKKEMKEVIDALKHGQVIALPTDTVYGVGVLYGNLDDLDRLKHAKHRPETKPIPMMVANLEQMERIAKVDQRTAKIVKEFLPGPLTLVLPKRDAVKDAYTNGMDTIAIRIPEEDFILELIEKLDTPLLVSSANVSGKPAAINVEQVKENLPNIDGLVLGTCKEMQASTIVDCTKEKLQILRPGPISLETLIQTIKE